MPSIGRLRYLETPASPRHSGQPSGTLVLLHAFPVTAEMWEPQFVLADRGWRVIAPYFDGMGGGDAPANPAACTMDDYAGQVVDLLDGLHVDQAVVAGLSMGGYVALAMFRWAERYFRALVLADTRAEADTPDARSGRQQMLQTLRERGVEAVADAMLPRLLGETTRRTRPDVVSRVRDLVRSNAAGPVEGAIHALMSRADSTGVLSTIHCPVLVVAGEEDTITPVGVAEGLHRSIAGSELALIPGAGHLSNLENSRAFNEALGRFLDHRV